MALSIGVILGILAMICWGASDFLAAHATRKSNAIKTFFWSMFFNFVIYVAIFFTFFDVPVLSAASIFGILAMGAINTIAFIAFYNGMHKGKVGVVSPITNTWPIVTVIFALAFLGESLTALQIWAATLVIAGAILTSFKLHEVMSLSIKKAEAGVGLALLAAFMFGIFFIFVDVFVEQLGWFIPFFLTKAVQIPYLIGYSKISKTSISFPRYVMWPLLAMGILEATGFVFYGVAITKEYTALVAPIISTIPLVTVVLARIFFRELLDINQKIGIFAIVAGIIILSL